MKSERITDSSKPLATIRLPMQFRFLRRSQLLIHV
jgi:hypothetical protein